MDGLIDDALFLVLGYLNLNERASMRLVSKKWKYIVDKIVVRKLAIFHNLPPKPGRLKIKNERFCLGDTVHVEKWDSFIRNAFVTANLLRSIEKMVVMSNEKRELNFYDLKFDRLSYLELHDVRISEQSAFLESNRIETLFLYYRDNLDYFRKENEDIAKMNKKFGFLKLLSRLKKLKHLNIRNKLTIEFFQNWTQILNKIEQLDVHIRDVKTLLYINNEYPNLKTLNVFVSESLDKFGLFLSDICLNGLKRKLRKDLQVSLYNIPFERENIGFMCDYLLKSKNQIKLCNSELTYIVDENCQALMDEYRDQQHLLERFYNNISILIFQVPYLNQAVYRKMVNIEYLNFHFKNYQTYDYENIEKFLEIFTNLKELKLLFDVNQACGSEILQLLPIYCWTINSIIVKCASERNYDYTPLLQLANLKYVKLILVNCLDDHMLIQLVHQLDYLTHMEITFNRTAVHSERHICFTQDHIRQDLNEILVRKRLAFDIETQRTLDSDLIFYTLKKR